MYFRSLQTIFRGFKRNKVYTTLNIIGLAVGFACVLCISLYIKYETSFDQFVSNYEKVFRLSNRSFALTSPAHLEYLAENLEEIEGGANTNIDYRINYSANNHQLSYDFSISGQSGGCFKRRIN